MCSTMVVRVVHSSVLELHHNVVTLRIWIWFIITWKKWFVIRIIRVFAATAWWWRRTSLILLHFGFHFLNLLYILFGFRHASAWWSFLLSCVRCLVLTILAILMILLIWLIWVTPFFLETLFLCVLHVFQLELLSAPCELIGLPASPHELIKPRRSSHPLGFGPFFEMLDDFLMT